MQEANATLSERSPHPPIQPPMAAGAPRGARAALSRFYSIGSSGIPVYLACRDPLYLHSACDNAILALAITVFSLRLAYCTVLCRRPASVVATSTRTSVPSFEHSLMATAILATIADVDGYLALQVPFVYP